MHVAAYQSAGSREDCEMSESAGIISKRDSRTHALIPY